LYYDIPLSYQKDLQNVQLQSKWANLLYFEHKENLKYEERKVKIVKNIAKGIDR
jgi:hypothetical protein